MTGGIKFDRTLNLGHLITAFLMVGSIYAFYFSLLEEVHINSERIAHLEKIVNIKIDNIDDKLADIKKELRK